MIDLSKIRYFTEVARCLNLTKAAENLGLHQASLSRAISSLEKSMGWKLFKRHHHGVALTPAGRELLAVAEKTIREFDRLNRQLHDEANEPEGELHIQTTFFLGSEWLSPLMAGFLELYPKLRLRLEMNSRELDLNSADAIIRTYIQGNPRLIQIPVLKRNYAIYASQAYLDQHGIPKKPSDLDHHKIITFFGEEYTPLGNSDWLLQVGKKSRDFPRQSAIVANSFHAIVNLVKGGCGLAAFPDEPILTEAGLVRVLPKIESPVLEIYLIFEKDREHAKKISSLASYLSSKYELFNLPQKLEQDK